MCEQTPFVILSKVHECALKDTSRKLKLREELRHVSLCSDWLFDDRCLIWVVSLLNVFASSKIIAVRYHAVIWHHSSVLIPEVLQGGRAQNLAVQFRFKAHLSLHVHADVTLFVRGWSLILLIKSQRTGRYPTFIGYKGRPFRASLILGNLTFNSKCWHQNSRKPETEMLEPCALNEWRSGTVVSRSVFLLPRSQAGVAELITANSTLVTWSNYPTDLCAAPQKQLRYLKSTLINTFIHPCLWWVRKQPH